MTFDQIKSFYLVAVLGTFAKAAEQLNTTQPTISARIAALEDRLGVSLFDRSGHRVALTPQGRSFLRSAEKLLEIQAKALKRYGKGELRGIVRIGASDTMAVIWIPPFLAALRAANPDAEFELHIGPSYRLRDELLARQIDIGFIVGPISNPQMINHLLCDCPMVFAAAPSLGLHGRKLTPAEIDRMDIFTFERMTRPHQDLLRDLRKADIAPRLNPINSLQTTILMVRKGLGIGAVPLGSIEEEVATGSLVVVDTEFKLTDVRFTVCYPQGPDTHVPETLTERAIEFLKARGSSDSIKLLY
ncbi:MULTISPECIES: LysR family transcriptional regulator [unclassified Mesorhizobium]|uniref:LysR family transcriptional regulator n=2 Tax=Mesorhizobium TaxID=68287 RepID=UPI000F764B93|nr:MULTISPECIES: LysR family transcriptional regulator [unclassified Mesorhizobium]TGP56567.1 LysR family transcriptional regulator [bacterium M00.F.Ca.ET.230.01.1.1]TGP74919.1 LysR family transcriptional regulator [bacterium M00.F.Ca.ET.227.01.1.1]TGP85246.1 LysR family transcriptional regulator [bacterium M00.F.Ca.ET.221.01.1.1]TGP89672.1 LysR family transcriptional regulator [bacterium M00.F.Ca.ET.222.01.1.1]TGT67827.1 LysR family transcriptional regulator [bacterium M00.F.Ca.ET.159.01.1.1]